MQNVLKEQSVFCEVYIVQIAHFQIAPFWRGVGVGLESRNFLAG